MSLLRSLTAAAFCIGSAHAVRALARPRFAAALRARGLRTTSAPLPSFSSPFPQDALVTTSYTSKNCASGTEVQHAYRNFGCRSGQLTVCESSYSYHITTFAVSL